MIHPGQRGPDLVGEEFHLLRCPRPGQVVSHLGDVIPGSLAVLDLRAGFHGPGGQARQFRLQLPELDPQILSDFLKSIHDH
jgi:hypothetical protein